MAHTVLTGPNALQCTHHPDLGVRASGFDSHTGTRQARRKRVSTVFGVWRFQVPLQNPIPLYIPVDCKTREYPTASTACNLGLPENQGPQNRTLSHKRLIIHGKEHMQNLIGHKPFQPDKMRRRSRAPARSNHWTLARTSARA